MFNKKKDTLPFILLILSIIILLLTGYNPAAGKLSWFLEVAPALIGIIVLILTYRRFQFSPWVYCCIFLHTLILIYGGYYTYAKTPLGNWIKDLFELGRNHYDRIGHFVQGFFPAFVIREIFIRQVKIKQKGWLIFLVVATALGLSAFWELIEWGSVYVVAPDVGVAFLGSQGDIWDAQWDMFLALIGASIAVLFFSKWHDKSMKSVVK